MFVMDAFTQRAIKKYPHLAADIAQSYNHKQVQCKEWLCDNLEFINHFEFKRIYIAGSWYGNVLVPKLKNIFPGIQIKLHDIDEDTVFIAKNIFFKDDESVKAEVVDSRDYLYKYLVINTSCEHMAPLKVRPGTCVALQSNNYREIEEHTNCIDSAAELAEQYKVKEVYYEGELEFDKYTRYMVIGRV